MESYEEKRMNRKKWTIPWSIFENFQKAFFGQVNDQRWKLFKLNQDIVGKHCRVNSVDFTKGADLTWNSPSLIKNNLAMLGTY